VISPPEHLSDTSRDVSNELNAWLAALPNDTHVELGTHRVERGVKLTDKNVVLTGGKLFNTSTEPVRYGVQLLKVQGGNVTLDGVDLTGSYPGRDPDNPLKYFEWTGVRLHGVESFTMVGCSVEKVGGDFMYVSKRGSTNVPSRGVQIFNNSFQTAGRHGFVVNGAVGCVVDENTIKNVARWVVDIEPDPPTMIEGLSFTGNVTGGGQHGFLHLSAGLRSQVANLDFSFNTIVHRQMVVWLERNLFVRRSGFTLRHNVCTDAEHPYRGTHAMIRVGNWSDVHVDYNRAYVAPEKATALPWGAEANLNQWLT
jgi:hypothetical protein